MDFLNSVKKILASPRGSASEYDQLIESLWKEWVDSKYPFYWTEVSKFLNLAPVLAWPDAKKFDLLCYLIQRINAFEQKKNNQSFNEKPGQQFYTSVVLFKQLFPKNIQLDHAQLLELIRLVQAKYSYYSLDTLGMVSAALKLVGYNEKNHDYSEGQRTIFKELRRIVQEYMLLNPDVKSGKLKVKLDQLFFYQQKGEDALLPMLFLGKDDFALFANDQYSSFSEQDKQAWQPIIKKAQAATGSKPSQKYLDDSKKLITELGTEKFKNTLNTWMEFLVVMKETITPHSQVIGGQNFTYNTHFYLSPHNIDRLRGLIWICSHFYDGRTVQNLAALAERCFKKIPGVGAIAAGLGNACLFALYKSKGMDGIGQLTRLKLRVKQNSTQQIIEKYLFASAEEKGISVQEIEDISVEDHGLVDGERSFLFDDYSCLLKVISPGKSSQTWLTKEGKEQKTVPAQVKEKQAAKLKKLKDTQKQVDQTSSAQKERIDRMFRADRSWTMEAFQANYFEHGLLSVLTKKIIWVFHYEGSTHSLLYHEGQWVNTNNDPVLPHAQSTVSLWHPATSSLDEIQKWRAFLTSHKIVQPLKQAFREVYLLTEAELRTRTYSNRMAAHILKQHQYVTLAKGRNWTAKLQGYWDGGADGEIAELKLPEHKLRAQFWTQGVEGGNQANDSGIYSYVSTDQVRFLDDTSGEPIDLIEVPGVVFSEVLRDVDLFVGVASVGNDPNWLDSGGIPAYREYWTSFSFGELSESAKSRKEILEGLLPRLKISKVAEVSGKFLVVKGKIRTYKIHLGSTNILMEPNDQYLCIVPDRSQKSYTENLYLPFEGDAGLSIILSKAFLLADDDKIKDSSITSQLQMR